MRKPGRQLTVAAIGFVVAWGGAFLRVIIMDNRTHDILAAISTFGRIRTAYPMGMPNPATSWSPTRAVEAFGSLATSIFCLGLLLMAAALIAWMLTPRPDAGDRPAT
jgi:hypothetical protein